MPVPDWWTRVLTTLALASVRALSQIGTPGHLPQQGVAISMERWRGTLHLDPLQVCLLDGMLCTVLSHLQCAGSGGRVTGAPNRAPLGIMWGPSWVETSRPQWGRRGSPGWGWGLPLGRGTAQWRDAVTLKVTGTLETPCYSDGGTPPGRILARLWEQGHAVVLCEIFKYIKKILYFVPSCLIVLGAERQLLSRKLNMFLSLRECRWQHS